MSFRSPRPVIVIACCSLSLDAGADAARRAAPDVGAFAGFTVRF